MESKPTAQHRWLQQLVGDWTYTNEASMGPGQPPIHSSGTERVRKLGEFWVLFESEGKMPDAGDTHTMIITLGFEPKRDRFVGTFVGSMMDSMWIYEGTLDADQRVLTLATDGPSFDDPNRLSRYHDSVTIVSPDERLLTSAVQLPDGNWNQFMKATYRRKR